MLGALEERLEKKYYVFNVLPFGISSAAFIFTNVLRKVVKYWRSLGLKVITYVKVIVSNTGQLISIEGTVGHAVNFDTR